MSEQRAVPFYCPFCGDEDLRPTIADESQRHVHGAWHCRSCTRVFSLKLVGLVVKT
jgi:transposase-like protein